MPAAGPTESPQWEQASGRLRVQRSRAFQVGKSGREDAAEGGLKKLRDLLCIRVLGGSSDDRRPPAPAAPGRQEMAVSPSSRLPRALLMLTCFQLCKPDSGRRPLGPPLWPPHPHSRPERLGKGLASALRGGPRGAEAPVAGTEPGRCRRSAAPSYPVRPPGFRSPLRRDRAGGAHRGRAG